jgi:hypothetical protein
MPMTVVFQLGVANGKSVPTAGIVAPMPETVWFVKSGGSSTESAQSTELPAGAPTEKLAVKPVAVASDTQALVGHEGCKPTTDAPALGTTTRTDNAPVGRGALPKTSAWDDGLKTLTHAPTPSGFTALMVS